MLARQIAIGSALRNYWQYLEDWIRFVSLLAGFAILVFVGYRRVAPSPSPGPA